MNNYIQGNHAKNKKELDDKKLKDTADTRVKALKTNLVSVSKGFDDSFKLINTGRIFRRFQSNLIPEIRIVKIVSVIKRVKAMAL